MRLLLCLALVAACTPDDGPAVVVDDTPETVDTPETTDTTTPPLDLTTPAIGDLSCVTAEGGRPPPQVINPDCVEEVPLGGSIRDFITGATTAGVQVEIFLSDDTEGAVDRIGTSDAAGLVTGAMVPTCTPWSSRATDPAVPGSPAVYQNHWHEEHYTPMEVFLTSVTSSSLDLLAGSFGLTRDGTTGFVAGVIRGCDDGRTPLQHVQVIVRDEAGAVVEGQLAAYLDATSRPASDTSTETGVFVIANIPPGAYTVEGWALFAEGGAPSRFASTRVRVYADAITGADVFAGSDDGVMLPETCERTCGPFPVEG